MFSSRSKSTRTDSKTGIKVIFLDIDGVLNSTRTCIAFDGSPRDFSPKYRPKFDEVAVGMLRALCAALDILIVVSSSWRSQFPYTKIGASLDLPTIGQTPELDGCRGDEIAVWLAAHSEVKQYAILDDAEHMLPEQWPHFVHTDPNDGLSFKSFNQLCIIFGTTPFQVLQTSRSPKVVVEKITLEEEAVA
ncbi:MAG: hypothetical protein EPN64_11055 [Burkholderiaceae bacterium]|nr:MAG: hypothetical protein EPN64_11055 [Burkholderiaceae bacterium]